MTTDVALTRRRPILPARVSDGLPVLAMVLGLFAIWYIAALAANWTGALEAYARAETPHTAFDTARATMMQDRPVLPAPHQILVQVWRDTVEVPIDSKRNLLFHAGVTLSAALAGFAIGTTLGVALAVAVVHFSAIERSVMPWLVASQTIPILAIAPIIIVPLGAIGFTGLLPKAIIAAYLCFFPVTVSMVKGLNAPDRQSRDLMRTYAASTSSVLLKLRLPSALPFFFAGLKIAVAGSLVGTIVAELPTGAQAGIGARLLMGSYYGQTLQIWAALVVAGSVATLLVQSVRACEIVVSRAMGVRAVAPPV